MEIRLPGQAKGPDGVGGLHRVETRCASRGDVKLAVRVMAHPARHRAVAMLAARLSNEALMLGSFITSVAVVMDPGDAGAWGNGSAAWRDALMDDEVTHILVLQDDISVCRDLLGGVIEAIIALDRSGVSGVPLTLFANRHIVEIARANAGHWVRLKVPLNGQAYCLPTSIVNRWLTWVDGHVVPSLKSYDRRFCAFVLSRRILTWATVPSLVDHAGWATSLMGHRAAPGGRRRVARWFLGESASALGIDWTKGIANAPLDRSGHLALPWRVIVQDCGRHDGLCFWAEEDGGVARCAF